MPAAFPHAGVELCLKLNVGSSSEPKQTLGPPHTNCDLAQVVEELLTFI